MTSSTANADWQANIVGPQSRIVPPVRFATVPWDAPLPAHNDIPWIDANGPVPLSADSHSCVVVDFGMKVAGFLLVSLQGAARASIDILTGPVTALTRFQGRLDVENATGPWRAPDYRALRYCKIHLAEPRPCITAEVTLDFTAYPAVYRGHFTCSDPILTRAWYVGAYTVQLCTQPHQLSSSYQSFLPRTHANFIRSHKSPHGDYVIWDGPRRDREIWLGDMWPEMLTFLYAFGDTAPVKASLGIMAAQQFEDGSIPGSGASIQPFGEYACWWVALLDRYHLLTDDTAFIAELEPNLRRMIAWLRLHLANNGGWLTLPDHQTWAWTLARQGVITGSQCVAYSALCGAARLMALLGDKSATRDCVTDAKQLAARIRTQLWDNEAGAFRDSLCPADGVTRYSCDSNALACIFHVASPEMARRALDLVRARLWDKYGTRVINPVEPPNTINWAHNHNVWPFVVGLEAEGRLENNDFAGAAELYQRCWGNMVKQGAETFWEMVDGQDGTFVTRVPIAKTQPGWDAWDSYAHGWSGGISYLLQAYMLGIRPVTPGFRHFLFTPRLMGLNEASGAIPTPLGTITVSIHRDGDGHIAEINVPAGTTASYVSSGVDAETGELAGGLRHTLRVRA
ncbi:MAG: hypothetical protein NTY46_11525 [Candidatus Sumerlaeota bacterium]|nr:hypothetical protein [Candidatus Sumerlaeota bacterium]